MNDSELLRPTAEFRDHLEWEVTRAVRREQRLSVRDRSRQHRGLRVATFLLAAVALGATGGLASAQMRDAARRDSLLESARADLALASVRLDVTRAQLEQVHRRVQTGAAGMAAMVEADAEHHAMQARAMRAQFDLEEIIATGRSPRDDLNAPLVNGRDFMSERLRLELSVLQKHLTAAEQKQTEAARRERLGAADPFARLDAEVEVVRARAALAVAAERLRHREEYLERGTPVEELLRRQHQTELRQETLVVQRALALARERLGVLEKRHAVGAAEELDVLRARVEVRERELELRSLATALRQLSP